MTAETLRRAAALMRERAEAASTGYEWEAKAHPYRRDSETVQDADGTFLAHYCQSEFAKHAASWHPAVALAVADLLDYLAPLTDGPWGPDSTIDLAVRIAETYPGDRP